MVTDSRVPEPRLVRRVDFLRRSGREVVQAAAEVLSAGGGPWLEALERLASSPVRLADAAALGVVPRLFFARGRAVYAWWEDGQARAVLGGCPRDGNLVQWHQAGDHFRCAYCLATYERAAPGGEGAGGMRRLALTVGEDGVWLRTEEVESF